MTGDQRMKLHRHQVAAESLTPEIAPKVTIRAGLSLGISKTDIARHLGVSFKTVARIAHKRRQWRSEFDEAQYAVRRARQALRVAEGRQRAAIARLEGRS